MKSDTDYRVIPREFFHAAIVRNIFAAASIIFNEALYFFKEPHAPS